MKQGNKKMSSGYPSLTPGSEWTRTNSRISSTNLNEEKMYRTTTPTERDLGCMLAKKWSKPTTAKSGRNLPGRGKEADLFWNCRLDSILYKVSMKEFEWLKGKVLEIEDRLEKYKKQQTSLAAKP